MKDFQDHEETRRSVAALERAALLLAGVERDDAAQACSDLAGEIRKENPQGPAARFDFVDEKDGTSSAAFVGARALAYWKSRHGDKLGDHGAEDVADLHTFALLERTGLELTNETLRRRNAKQSAELAELRALLKQEEEAHEAAERTWRKLELELEGRLLAARRANPANATPETPTGIGPLLAALTSLGVPAIGLEAALLPVLVERARQAQEWGGAKHDDAHPLEDFVRFVRHQVDRAAMAHAEDIRDARGRFVRIAALALATLESIDRRVASAQLKSQPEVV